MTKRGMSLARAEDYMQKYETEFLSLIEADQSENGGQGAGIGRSILERASKRIGPERFLSDPDGIIAAIREARAAAVNGDLANVISLTGPKTPEGLAQGKKLAAKKAGIKGFSRYHVPGHIKDIEDIKPDARYWMDPDGEIYDVDATKALGHRGFAADYLNASLGTAASRGWIRIVNDQNDPSTGGTVYWEGVQASNAQLRSIKDIAAVLGFEVERDRGGTIAYDSLGDEQEPPSKAAGAKRLGRSPSGAPTTAAAARLPGGINSLARLWNGTKQTFWNSPGLEHLGDHIHMHVDLMRKYTGEFNAPFTKWAKELGPLGAVTKKQAKNQHQEWREKKAGRQALPALSPQAKKLKDVYDNVIAKVNSMNSTLGVKVKNPDTGKYVPIPRIEYPAKVKESVMQALRDPQYNKDMWNDIRDALIAEKILPAGSTDAQVQAHLDRVLAQHTKNGAFGRFFFFPRSLPSIAFDYSHKAMSEFLAEWIEKVAQVKAFGNNPNNDVFDIAASKVAKKEMRDYIKAVKKLAYGETINDFWGRMATAGGQVAALWHLANFASATKNLLSGMGFNFTALGRHGIIGFFQVVPFRAVSDAEERGIIVRDLMNVQADGERMAGGDVIGKVTKGASLATQMGLKASGFNAAEVWVRGVSMRGSESLLRHAIKHYNKNPRSKTTLRYMAYFQRLGIRDIDGLLTENGKGEITDEYLRASVNAIQGGYTYADVPVYMEEAAGKAILKYRKWGAEQAKYFEREVITPLLRTMPMAPVRGTLNLMGANIRQEEVEVTDAAGNKTMEKVPPGMMPIWMLSKYIILIGLAGAGEEWLLEKWFGIHPKTRRLAEIMAQWRQSNWDGFKASVEKIWQLHLLAGSMGGIGNYLQEGFAFFGLQDAKPGESAAESIPALDPLLTVIDGVQMYMEQGNQGAGKVFLEKLQSVSGFRVGAQAYAQTGIERKINDVFGTQFRYAEKIANRQDLAELKGIQRRYQDDKGIKRKKPSGERPEKTEKSIWRDPLDDALRVGDVTTARQIIRSVKAGMRRQRWEEIELPSLKSHITSSQPIPGEANRAEVIKWARQNTSPYQQELMRRLDNTYRKSAQRIGLGIEFKAPSLEDRMKHRQQIKLKQEQVEYETAG